MTADEEELKNLWIQHYGDFGIGRRKVFNSDDDKMELDRNNTSNNDTTAVNIVFFLLYCAKPGALDEQRTLVGQTLANRRSGRH